MSPRFVECQTAGSTFLLTTAAMPVRMQMIAESTPPTNEENEAPNESQVGEVVGRRTPVDHQARPRGNYAATARKPDTAGNQVDGRFRNFAGFSRSVAQKTRKMPNAIDPIAAPQSHLWVESA